ncbi:MAG: hypothetical protein M1813_004863 [Trichoglossum hirsutum]|nr:MAG: hypothetical protein M1813_004863 [Trichoglossum hirsutum]
MKQTGPETLHTHEMRSRSWQLRSRSRLLALALLFMLAFLMISFDPWLQRFPFGSTPRPEIPLHGLSNVRLEAHIMSKCPDARDCLRDLVVPTMEKVHDIVDFKLSFIGTPTEGDDGVACKHGPGECLGNMLELCAASLYPDPKISLGFTMCLSNDYEHIPDQDLIESCALEHSVDFSKLNHCVSRDDGYGIKLLRESMERSAEAGIKTSCTVRLNEEVRCVLDSGQWEDCGEGHEVGDLVRDIRALYQGAADWLQ